MAKGREGPLQPVPSLHVRLKGLPHLLVGDWARVAQPDSEHVVNEATVEGEVLAPGRDEVPLMESIEYSGPGRGGRDSHPRARHLLPGRVAKLKVIIPKD